MHNASKLKVLFQRPGIIPNKGWMEVDSFEDYQKVWAELPR
ncbi:MAG: hypothetical protein V3T42_12135 [Nitrospirales bacterium]